MQKRFLALIFFTFSYICFSQDLVIQGRVQDEKSLPVAFANVVVFNNGAFVNGTTTNDNGYFQIENLNASNYILKVSFLGYESVELPISLTSDITVENIILKEIIEALDGVIVIAKKPTVKRMVDRIVFNVENSTLSNNNVLDVLKQTPGVLVHDGNITVKNATPVVYINDRRVHLSIEEVQQLLQGTPAENIKSIEVITNPPARYEAEGGAVLNIVTSKNIVAGYHGSIFGNFKQGSEFPKYSYGTSHFFKTKKLSTYINFSDNPRKDFTGNDEFVNFFNNNQVTSRWESFSSRIRENSKQNINTTIDYEIDQKNSLSFTSNMLISPRRATKTSEISETNVYGLDKLLDSIFKTNNSLRDETFNFAFDLDYVHNFDRKGEKLSVNGHHTYYDFSSFQNVDTDYLFADESLIRENRFQTFSSQTVKLFTGQIDYTLPINESSNFETGAKVSNINSESILNQFTFDNGIRQEDTLNSDTFLYDETNYAIYGSFGKTWDKWDLKLGLRTEYTNIKGNSILNNQVNNNDYIKFFPTFYLQHKVDDKNEVYFNYKKRIFRPRYNQLNPFKYFLNDNAYITGNPSLKPQIDDVFTFGYSVNKDFTFELYYRYEKDPALEIVFQDNIDKKLKYVNTNIDSSISYGLDFIAYTNILTNWSFSTLSSIYYTNEQFFALESNNELTNNNRWAVFIQIANYFTFLKDRSLLLNISMIYTSRDSQGASVVSDRSGVDLSIRKNLIKNKASLSIGITDIFNGLNYNKSTKYLNQDILRETTLENRMLTFGFNYKFGNTKLQNNNKTIDLEERDRLND
ncbi:TonB-dependent receptor [Seonamhaeicola sediminis]|uniref:TonB-dependent receptor n=1 Tax=Seonamhaeicola sediminis TaxID=2528206 RepID=A0A562YEG3_9FLAO|nr:outer membrane beta-barrel family protein [Seonamhaeicola sediminis]TWO33037.1 TonB-dependent receptor [Seonamhaeicola sediminis]